ncbi:guanyl-specific ribonuclease pgl-3-like [Camellia sinensis]|uniref:guanyl-specific ribonuclease pgl-3-like n=1 Tax=Camellia sinensis TaxID=4442 RepID=UPI001036DCE7|nr:guanyl-specific ribonuclease pgl-3-like [Camellia sinensis]
MGWIWHSLEPHVATTVEFCDTSKEIWDSLADSFSNQSNVSRVYELYEQIFAIRQFGRSLLDYYSSLKTLWDQLLQHRPLTTDVNKQKQHWEEFMMASLLSGLDPKLRGFKDQILAILSSVDRRSTRGGFLGTSGQRGSYSGSRGSRGAGSCGGGSRGGFRGGCSSGPSSRTHGDRKCTHCGSQGHTKPWCWKKYGKSDHVHHVMDVPSSQSSLLSTGSNASPVNSHETLTTQISELTALAQSSTSTPDIEYSLVLEVQNPLVDMEDMLRQPQQTIEAMQLDAVHQAEVTAAQAKIAAQQAELISRL